MKFKSLKAVLVLVSVVFASPLLAENSEEKADRIEQQVNEVFMRAVNTATYKLTTKKPIYPFAVIAKKDGSFGVFELDLENDKKKRSVNDIALSVRRYLSELAVADQILASTLVMFASVQKDGVVTNGVSFEVEHIDGISIARFLPIGKNEKTSDIIVHTEAISTSPKPATVFTDMVKAVVKK